MMYFNMFYFYQATMIIDKKKNNLDQYWPFVCLIHELLAVSKKIWVIWTSDIHDAVKRLKRGFEMESGSK